MKVKSKSYPHPVLGNEDDVRGAFDANFVYELGNESVVLRQDLKVDNKSIAELIKKGSASFVTEVECRSTFYRRSFPSQSHDSQLVIPARLLRERVSIGFFVCANKPIAGYSPVGMHQDYDGMNFDIEPGDVLAVGGYSSFIAEKSFDPLRPPVSSFMSIRVGDRHEGPAEVWLDSDKIVIVLSKADWTSYNNVRSKKWAEGVLHSSIVFPALITAVQEAQTEGSQYSDNNWYQRLRTILEAKGLSEREPFEAAQRIIDNPLARSFKGIASVMSISESQDYD